MIKIITPETDCTGRPWGCRGYRRSQDRKRAIRQLAKRGINYFVVYRDTQAEFALQFAVSDWVTAQNIRWSGGPGEMGPHVSRWVSVQ